MKKIILVAVTFFSITSMARRENITCDSTPNNGATRSCFTRSGSEISNWVTVSSRPLTGSSVTIPCVHARDSYNNIIFENFRVSPDRKSVVVWGGCNLDAIIETQESYYFTDHAFKARDHRYTEYSIGPNADQVSILWQNGKCSMGSTLAWDLNRQVLAINGHCEVTVRVRHVNR